ncbi:MAG: sigma-54-dependent Fis family transcriptional regulator, partial [Winogradskyella sp.]|nr:sigma-54-dependent Fis family transcriptional regulator [Winogradskyella sp.]
PDRGNALPAVIKSNKSDSDFSSEREILYKVLFDMKSDLNDLKKLTMELMKSGDVSDVKKDNEGLIQKIYGEDKSDIEDAVEDLEVLSIPEHVESSPEADEISSDKYHFAQEIEEEETLSLQDKELELIKKSLERHNGKRKLAAAELGISERTLYRKIKQYDL